MTPNEILDKLSRIQGILADHRNACITAVRFDGDTWIEYDEALLRVAQCRDDHRPEQETT